MSPWLWLAFALAVHARPAARPAPWPSPPKVAETAPALRPVRTATVRYVAKDRASLDRGTRDGLTVGATVELTRLGRVVSRCTVDSAADAWSICRAPAARIGDGLRYTPIAPPKAPRVPPPVTPPPAAEVLRERDAISTAPFPLVATAGTEAERPSLHASARLQNEAWAMISRPTTTFDAASVHLQIAGAELGHGFRLYVDASAYQWLKRPSTFRAPDRAETQLFVEDLEIAQRELGRSWVLAAGRVWAYRAAGLGVFDGAQAGWRSRDGEWEAGGFGGAVPDPATLAPSGSSPIAGAYAAYLHSSSREATLRWIDVEAHAAVLPRSNADTRFQLETLARAWVASVDLAGDVQLAPSGSEHLLEGARLSLAGEPVRTLHLTLSGRYDALPDDIATLPGETFGAHRSRRADVIASWDALPGLSLGADAGHVRDLDTQLWHAFIGPQVGLPRLFGGKGGLSLGYLEEGGDSPGRSAWLQATWSPAGRLYLLGRASWFHDRARIGEDSAFDELGLYAHGDWRFTRALWVRLSALGRLDLSAATSSSELPTPFALDATLALGGDF